MTFVLLYGVTLTAQDLTNTWTGGGSTNWSDAGNWDLGVPDTNHVVRLGAALDKDNNPIANVVQDVNLDIVGVEIWSLLLACEGDRPVNLQSSIGAEIKLLATGTHTATPVHMSDTATASAILNVVMKVTAWSNLRNDSTNAMLTVGPDGQFHHGTATAWVSGEGTITRYNFTGDTYFGTFREPSLAPKVVFRGNSAGYLQPFIGSEMRFAADNLYFRALAPMWVSGSGTKVGTVKLSVIESGGDDRVIRFTRGLQCGVNQNDFVVKMDDSADGSTGAIILRLASINNYAVSRSGSQIETRVGDTVEFYSSAESGIGWSPHPRIVGEGNIWISGGAKVPLESALSYGGRTIISNGELVLDSYNDGVVIHYGSLPETTIPEIANTGIMRLNGIDQTLGGIEDWRGFDGNDSPTSGTIYLDEATLTVNAHTNSVFGGIIEGGGVLVKIGVESLTLTAGYTNIVGRTLRVEQGLLAVTSTLDITQGDFEQAGGRVSAGNLVSDNASWNVTLLEADENQVLVDINNTANITQAMLHLAFAEGYTPLPGTEFILLRAPAIIGVESNGLIFQYQAGRGVELDDIWFRLTLMENGGYQSVVLTVIPPIARGTVIILR